MVKTAILAALLPLLSGAMLQPRYNSHHVPQKSGYRVAWSEDFLTDTTNFGGSYGRSWQIDTGTGYQPLDGDIHPYNWGTREVETMTSRSTNIFTRGGNLYIVPRRDSNGEWTSARIESKIFFNCDKGKKMIVEASVNLNPGRVSGDLIGIWPAFWAMGKSFRDNGNAGWPATGEWDIMEATNGLSNVVGGIHCDAPACNEPSGLSRPMSTSQSRDGGFHKFGLIVDRTQTDWRKQSISWTFDGAVTNKVTGQQIGVQRTWDNLTAKPYFVILNIAVGGAYPDALAGGTTPITSTRDGLAAAMLVDYVAVYKQN